MTTRRLFTKTELEKAGVYDEACALKGIDLDVVYEEMLDPPEELRLSPKEIRKLRLDGSPVQVGGSCYEPDEPYGDPDFPAKSFPAFNSVRLGQG